MWSLAVPDVQVMACRALRAYRLQLSPRLSLSQAQNVLLLAGPDARLHAVCLLDLFTKSLWSCWRCFLLVCRGWCLPRPVLKTFRTVRKALWCHAFLLLRAVGPSPEGVVQLVRFMGQPHALSLCAGLHPATLAMAQLCGYWFQCIVDPLLALLDGCAHNAMPPSGVHVAYHMICNCMHLSMAAQMLELMCRAVSICSNQHALCSSSTARHNQYHGCS